MQTLVEIEIDRYFKYNKSLMPIQMNSTDFFSFANNSNETLVECNYVINDYIIGKFNSRKVRILDIGSGSGEKMHYLTPYTSHRCGIEICTDLVDFSVYDEIIIGNALNPNLPISYRYDLTIASHILPYIPIGKYDQFLNNATSWTVPNGYSVIFEMTGDGVIGKIKEKILGKKLVTSSDKFDQYLEDNHVSHAAHHLNAMIKTKRADQMLEVVRFFCEKYETAFEVHSDFVMEEIKRLKKAQGYELVYYIKAYVFKSTRKN